LGARIPLGRIAIGDWLTAPIVIISLAVLFPLEGQQSDADRGDSRRGLLQPEWVTAKIPAQQRAGDLDRCEEIPYEPIASRSLAICRATMIGERPERRKDRPVQCARPRCVTRSVSPASAALAHISADLAEIKTFQRTPLTRRISYFWAVVTSCASGLRSPSRKFSNTEWTIIRPELPVQRLRQNTARTASMLRMAMAFNGPSALDSTP
jgi:hypothetical protein